MTVDTYKTLGQAVSVASTDVNVYTVPASTAAIVSTLCIANRSGTDDVVFVYVRVAGAATANKQLILPGKRVPANGVVNVIEGITLGAGDVVTINAGSANLSASLFGVEKTSITSIAPKVLGQVDVNANTLTDLYTVPGAHSAVISTVAISNINPSPVTMRLAVSVGGGAIANKDYLLFDYVLAANLATGQDLAGLTLTLGITMAAGDILRGRANAPDVIFNVFGVEIA